MYYVIRFGPPEDNVASLYLDPVPGYEKKKVPFYDGIKLGPLPQLTFRKRVGDGGTLVDYAVASPATTVVSSRFREVLNSAGVDNVDYYPAQILDEASGKATTGYYAANVVGMIDCIDKERSVFTTMPGFPADFFGKSSIFQLKRLYLDASKVHGAKIFRLFGKTSVLIVHESVKEAIEKAGLRGLRLVAAEGMEGFL